MDAITTAIQDRKRGIGMIVIKTMTNLPEHCYDCPCHNGESGYCQADKENRYSDYRPFWCPLVEIKVRILSELSEAESEENNERRTN
jgi:hypothetical protein